MMENGIFKNSSSAWAVLFILYFALNASAGEKELKLTAEEGQWIKDNPVIKVANENDWPPFDYAVDGEPLGYSVDMVRMVAEKTGLQVEFINGNNWAELLDKFQHKEIDLMPAVYINEERSMYMDFTESYFSQPSVIVVQKNNTSITGIASLVGKRVAGVKDFMITNALINDYPEIEVVQVDTVIEGIKAVSLGDADAYIDSIGLVSYTLENNFIPNLKIIGDVEMGGLSNPSLHMGVSKNNPVLFSIISKVLASISREEKLFLSKKWLEFTSYEKQMIFTEEQIQWIRKHPVVKIGVDADYAPYSFVDEKGNYVGIAPDFIDLVSEKTGIKFVIVPGLSWAEILDGAREKKLDVIATAVKTEARKEYLNFTPIYIPTPLVIMTRESDSRVNKLQDLAGLKVALVEGYSSSQRVLNEQKNIQAIKVKTPLEGLQSVAIGESDAYIGVIGVNAYLIRENGINNLKVASRYDLKTNGQRFAVRSDWNVLTVLITEALDSIAKEDRNKIYDKWINIPYTPQVDYSLFWKSLAAFLGILAFLYVYNRKLAAEVNRRKEAERILQATNQTLREAREIAEEANQAKSRFISSMSHELRTPLTAILGFSELMLDDDMDEVSAQRIKHIHDAGDHLVELINDILDLSHIESGKVDLDLQGINLNRLLSECLVLIEVSAQDRNIRIVDNVTTYTNYTIYADYKRFKQIVLNLLSNAIKYNRHNGSIFIAGYKLTGSYLKLEIQDTGYGLSNTQLNNLFKAFERLGAEQTEVEGTGIGLVISRRLIEAMNGEIGVKSIEGEGSTFWVTIPLASESLIS